MAVLVSGRLLLAPAPVATGTVAMALGLMLVCLAHHAASACALRTLALVVRHRVMVAKTVTKRLTGTPEHAELTRQALLPALCAAGDRLADAPAHGERALRRLEDELHPQFPATHAGSRSMTSSSSLAARLPYGRQAGTRPALSRESRASGCAVNWPNLTPPMVCFPRAGRYARPGLARAARPPWLGHIPLAPHA
jgi:hypothetical protein